MSEPTRDDILYGALKLLQPVDGPRVSVDTVLLSAAVGLKRGESVIELGSAHGAVILILARKYPHASRLEGLEIREDLVEMAVENARSNGLEGKVSFSQGDLKEIRTHYKPESYEVVLMNPPYNDPGKSRVSPNSSKALARHATACTLEDLASAAKYLLKPKGRFYLVLRASRAAEALCLSRQFALEPKRIRFVHPSPGKEATAILMMAMKQARQGLVVEPPLFITDGKGKYTPELLAAYDLGGSPCL